MRILPRMVNPLVYNMVHRHRGDVRYSDLGGLSKQIRDLRDYIELPLTNREVFQRVGVKLPKGVLLYGPPGTGKTLLARAIASNIDSTFMTVVIARRGSSEGEVKTSECDRVLIELLSQLDGFNELDKVKVIMATNRPDVLDLALLRPGRIDKKIEIPLPNGDSRMRILKIHASGITKHGDIDYEKVVKLSEGFNGADMRNICTEAGMLAIREDRDYVVPNDFIKAVTKLGEAKKLESSAQYNADFRKE
ncbi:P-loop containing nucleoside triphosphate hydrolase [Arabidopsis thaliana x Arabidopsis arenosa]|uniref:P-loop containing nucleoside triphosphate hydrolase n=1 Tax=Arabidopsis thaliana x Arabidopsis arenosa TaxID=1240361 RepID=A0A8T2BLC6_9BRAS|nr:P-loop containing nucleoside triphosphate hydrolase [Arabidopsis thaliana x Arabidopsis arenosa]